MNCHKYCWLGALLLGTLLAACRPAPVPMASPTETYTLADTSISRDVRRLAVFYPSTFEREWSHGYLMLERAVFQLKGRRPELRVLNRREVQLVTSEQLWHVSGQVSEETAVRVGQMLGADSIILFRIEGPGWRERVLARMYNTMPPVMVTSKIVRVETGEVLYHDVVRAPAIPNSKEWKEFASDFELQPILQAALDMGVAQTIAHLERAFR